MKSALSTADMCMGEAVAVAEEEEQLGADDAELSWKSSSSIKSYLLLSSHAVKLVAGQLRSSLINPNLKCMSPRSYVAPTKHTWQTVCLLIV